jgi:hypothetical protein
VAAADVADTAGGLATEPHSFRVKRGPSGPLSFLHSGEGFDLIGPGERTHGPEERPKEIGEGRLMEEIVAVEKEHADDLKNLLATFDPNKPVA